MAEKKSNPAFLKSKPKLLYIGLNGQAAGWLNQPHRHGYSEFLFMKTGSGTLKIENETYPLKPGDLVILNKGIEHSEFFENASKNEIIFFGMDGLNLEGGNILKNKSFCVVKTDGCAEAVLGYLEQLLYEAECAPPFSAIIKEHLLQIILALTARLAGSDLNLSFTKNSAYLEAKDYFDRNFASIDNLDNVCKTLYINKFYLTHIFKQQMGMPPIKYLILKRMELAKTLLATTDADINEVARRCGYMDTPYFCRVFRKSENTTPLQYRFWAKNKQNHNEL